jgi:hypothetical protein
MIRIQVQVDERTAAIGRSTAKLALLLSLLAIPGAAIASPLTVPNSFAAGTVISSSAMNANFAAVKASVDDNDTRIATLEGEVKPHACAWAVAQTPNSASVQVNCPANKYVAAGGCRRNATANLIYSLAGASGSYPANGAAPTAVSSWLCGWDAPSAPGHYAQALCCSF